MLELLPVFLPILLADIINPVLLAAVIFALGLRKPILLSGMVLMGWLLVYFGSGILIAIGLESILSFLNNPRPVDFYIEFLVAGLLFFFGIKLLFQKEDQTAKQKLEETSSLSPVGAFMVGASINLIGLPFAIPYFAALDQILKADLGWTESLLSLLIYNLLYILPFTVLIVIKLTMGEKSDPLLQTISRWMGKIGKVVLPAMMILIAIALIIDAVLYFSTGTPWF